MKLLVFIVVTGKRFPVSLMLMDQGFTVRMTTARTKRSNTASSSPFTYTATLASRPTQRLSSWGKSVSDYIRSAFVFGYLHARHTRWVGLDLVSLTFAIFLTVTPSFSPSLLFSVRPGELSNLHSSDGKVFSWSYPDSWEKPCTFFGLHFQVKVVHHGFTCDSREHRLVISASTVAIAFQLLWPSVTIIVWSLLLCSSTPPRKRILRSKSKLRSMFSACELKINTPVGRLAPGAAACKYLTIGCKICVNWALYQICNFDWDKPTSLIWSILTRSNLSHL